MLLLLLLVRNFYWHIQIVGDIVRVIPRSLIVLVTMHPLADKLNRIILTTRTKIDNNNNELKELSDHLMTENKWNVFFNQNQQMMDQKKGNISISLTGPYEKNVS